MKLTTLSHVMSAYGLASMSTPGRLLEKTHPLEGPTSEAMVLSLNLLIAYN